MPNRFAVHAEFAPTGELKAVIGAMMNGKPPLVADAICSCGNHCTGNVPAIDSAPAKNFRLAIGGVRMQFDVERHSATDYKGNGSAQFLPLTINDQNFGAGTA